MVLQVFRSIERYLGQEDLERFKLFLIEKKKLLSDSKELCDKLSLGKTQLSMLECRGESRSGKLSIDTSTSSSSLSYHSK